MGRRSINTTKSGKYMNPTDQARKEARKKELKKNKRQRQMVRAAVLKMKDPSQILDELEKIDEMEFNVLQPSPLNEKVLKEKRKKLRETFDRVLKMYIVRLQSLARAPFHTRIYGPLLKKFGDPWTRQFDIFKQDKDEPEKWVELKRQEMEYEKRRAHLISYYESVKHAQSVQVDDIPLPTLQVPENTIYGNMPLQIPLPLDPAMPMIPMKPILKKDSAYKERPAGVEPPGVPPGPPPDYMELLREVDEAPVEDAPAQKKNKTLRFSDMPEDEGPPGESTAVEPDTRPQTELTDIEMPIVEKPTPVIPVAAAPAPKPTSLQQRMLALSGQNIDEFMKEMEEVHKKRERDRAADLNARLNALDKRRPDQRDSDSDSEEEGPVIHKDIPPCILEPPGTEMRPHPPPLMPPGFRPPPLRVPLGPPPLRGPPGPPPGRPGAPPGPPPGLPPRMLRMPPGPPPGPPPRLLRPPVPPPLPKPLPIISVLTAAPQLIQKKDGVQGATISAKPQIRNLSADVTRFVPSALRVKREEKSKKPGAPVAPQRPADTPKQAPTKDDAYMQFMREMQGLL